MQDINISDEVKTKHLESIVKETLVTCSNAIRLRERFNLVIEAIKRWSPNRTFKLKR